MPDLNSESVARQTPPKSNRKKSRGESLLPNCWRSWVVQVRGSKDLEELEDLKASCTQQIIPGNPRKSISVTFSHLRHLVDKDPSASLSEITTRSGLKIIPWTAGRHLPRRRYWVRIARKEPYWDNRKMRERYTWYILQRKWEPERWKSKVYTDDGMVVIAIGGGPKKVRRPTRAHLPTDPRYLAQT